MEGEDLAVTVLTCEGDVKDPDFPQKLRQILAKLQNLISDGKEPIKVTNIEPWNSVRVTFNIPLEAAQRLRQLAERGDRVLRDLGILSVQIEGDQVITLTLASQYSEPQEIVLRKTSDEQGDVASVSFNLPTSDSLPGPSTAEPAHKNITQFLGHIVGGATASTSNASPSSRLEKSASPKTETSSNFRSPNVIAPISTEPIPFPPSSVITTTAAMPSSSRVSPNVTVKSSGFTPFPFASMTHAMNTKNSTSPQYQSVHVPVGNPRLLSPTAQLTNAIFSSSNSATSASKVSNSSLQKVSRTIANSAFNNVVSRTVPPNAIASTSRANVALSSPLLVNLLQSENSNLQQNNKLMPPPSQASNQASKKKRKPRKTKEKSLDDGNALSPSFSTSPSPPSYAGVRSPGGYDHINVLGSSLSVPIAAVSPPTSQIANIHPMAQGQPPVSNVKPQTPSIPPQGLPPVSLQPQVQGQPMVSTTRSPSYSHQTLSAFRQTQGHRAVPNIHPQAQGQPQVHTGNLPLHTHIPVGTLQVQRPSQGNTQSYAMSAPRTIPVNPTKSLFMSKDSPIVKSIEKTKEAAALKSDRTSAPSTPSNSTPDSNPFPSPPSSSDGKTKHLINPFTGQLEPMPSDEEEEEESIGSLPPFPDFEIDTSEKSQSERSLSDGGKDNNLSSDTDSGISKSITDVSQSSTECVTADSGRDSKKAENSAKSDSIPLASVSSSVPGEKIKLRLKLDSKSIRESKEIEKRAKDSTPSSNQKLDVGLGSIPPFKKSTTSSVPEPRVPPLHISLRGPNAAVVVSPRKDDSKSRHSSSKEDHSAVDLPSKGVQKKVRSPRASRVGESPSLAVSLSGRNLEPSDKKLKGNNSKDFKKVKDELWSPNVKMSGGGIVEVGDKLSTSRVSSYDAYLSSTSMGSPVVQRKSSNIFSLASRDSCKSEVMTLTSCSTGESVTLHSFAEAKSPLPLQVAAVSETEARNSLPTVKSEVSSNISSVVLPLQRTVSERIPIPESEKSSEDSKNISSSLKSSPLMQTNHLPHSPSAPLDSKNNSVQISNCPSDQTLTQSAISLNVVSTVPLSSHSASLPTCDTNEAASDSNVQTQESNPTDANRLSTPCSEVATPAEDVSSSTDSQKLQNSQCNINPTISNTSEPVESFLNVDKSVKSELKENNIVHTDSVNEVQRNDVNISLTANTENCQTSLCSENEASQSLIQDPSFSEDDGDKFKSFSTQSDSCNLSISPVTSTEAKESIPDNINVCTVDVKNVSNAQIITTAVDNSSNQSLVIEVPSTQNSPAASTAVPPKLGCSTEVKFLSTPLPSDARESLSTENIPVPKDSSHEGRVSPVNVSLHTMPCSTDQQVKLLTHVTIPMPSNTNESSTLYLKEELKLDPVEEERKRCMLLSEVPTSTPGPPPQSPILNIIKPEKMCSELSNSTNSNESAEIKTSENISLQKTSLDKQANAPSSDEKPSISPSSSKNSETKPDTTITSDTHLLQPTTSNTTIKAESEKPINTPIISVSSVTISSRSNPVDSVPSFVLSNLASASTNSIDAGTSFEARLTPKAEIKKDSISEPIHMVSTTANSLVTSLLSPVKYLHNEVSSQKFKLIFKGSGQRTSLPGGNTSGSLVVPLNSSKVPIKLVALPGGASALSVRSTSNPNIVEIIGPKTAQNSPSNSPHISSPVRLVVSKMASGMTCANPGNSPNMRNRVVVKSVVVTSTSPSIKLLSANNLCTTTPLSLNTGATSTSAILQSIPSAIISNSAPVQNTTNSVPDDVKIVTTAESSAILFNSTPHEKIASESNNSLISNSAVIAGSVKSIHPSNTSCSSSADSTTKDLCSDSPESKSSASNSAIADSSVKLTASPDTTSVNIKPTDKEISSPCPDSQKENLDSSENISSQSDKLFTENKCDKDAVFEKLAADTTTESATDEVISMSCNSENFVESDPNTHVPSSSSSDKCSVEVSESTQPVSEAGENLLPSAPSNDSVTVEQTADSAITTSTTYISNNLESSDVADSSVADSQTKSPENPLKETKLKSVFPPSNNSTNVNVESPKSCTVSNEETVENEVCVQASSQSETGSKPESESSNSLLENSLVVDCASSVIKSEVIETGDTDSLDAKLDVNMQKIRPLGEESIVLADSTESEDSKLLVEDSQLEISLVYSKPLKRKCSENAAELIKACMGVEDGPKRGVILKPKATEEVSEKVVENDKVEENVRMSLRIRREEPLLKKVKGTTNSDCSTDEEITLNELVTKSGRTRDRPTRGRISNRDSPIEPINCRPKRRRSGSNESRNSHNSEEIKIRTPRESKRESNKKDEPTKKLPERTKRGTFKAQDQVVVSKVGLQRSSRIRDQEVKSNALHNNKDEANSIVAKRKTRNTSESQEMLVAVKRRRYSKDGHR